jgi:hypothetical protein
LTATEVVAARPPGLQVAQRPLEDPQRQAAHESGLLSQGQEDVRVEQPPLGVVPPHERLHPDDGTGPELQLGLVVHVELVGVQGGPQLLQRLQPVTAGGCAVGSPDLHAVPPALGAVHGGVGAGQQQRAVAAVVGTERDTDARVDVEGHAVEHEGVAQGRTQAARDLLRASCVGFGQEDGELVTAHPGEEVAGLQSPLQAWPHQAQQVVAHAVPEAVVDLLEPVQIDHQDRAVRRSGAVDGRLQLLDEPAAVGQPGQRIVVGFRGQLPEAQLLDGAQPGVLDDERPLQGDLADGLADRGGPLPRLGDAAAHDHPEQPVAGEERHADVGGQVDGLRQTGIEQIAGQDVLD